MTGSTPPSPRATPTGKIGKRGSACSSTSPSRTFHPRQGERKTLTFFDLRKTIVLKGACHQCCSQFVLGSHEFDTPPPTEMNNRPTVAGEGVFADVVQVPFPAGSGILYDSRTYVRLQPSWRLASRVACANL